MRKAVLWLFIMAIGPSALAQNSGLTPEEARKAEAYFHFSMARVLDQQEEWTESIAEYRKALEIAPNDPDVYAAMARTFLNQRNPEEAIKAAQRAIEIDRDNLGAHRLLAEVHIGTLQSAQGRGQISQAALESALAGAIREYEEIIRIDPRGRDAYLLLASLYRFDEAPEKAAEIYKKFLGIEPGSEEGVVGLASLSISAGRHADAIEILKEFVANQPNSAGAWDMLGEAYSSLGDTAGAAEAFRRAAALNNDPELREKLANALLEDNQLEEAAKIFEGILQDDSGSIRTLQQLGQIYRRLMRYDEARELLNSALARSRNNLGLRFDLALVDRDEGKFEDALRGFETLLKDTQKSTTYTQEERGARALFYTHVGLLNSLLTRFDQAIVAFNNVRSLSEPDARNRVDMMIADTYKSARNLERAQATLEEALKYSPDSRELQMAYADLLAERGRVDEGIGILQKLGQGRDPDLALLSAMTGIYERAERFPEAQKVLDTAAQSFGNDLQVHFLQGALHEQQMNYTEAEAAFRRALALDNNNPSVLNYLGYMLADRGVKLDEALAMIRKAVNADPINGAFLDSLGWVYFKLERLDLAEQYLKRAVIFAATNATMHDHLGDLYFKTGRFKEAASSWTTGLQYAEDPEEAAQIRQKLEQVKSRIASR